nr:hypothetical protein [Tanacetum cinerariifolium]
MVHTVKDVLFYEKKLEEDLVSCLKYFHDASESSDDSTNVVNAPREPFVVKQDHGVKSSQNPPPIDECCCECGEALDGIFCQQCIFQDKEMIEASSPDKAFNSGNLIEDEVSSLGEDCWE